MEIGRDLSVYLLDVQRGERTRAIQSWFEKKIKQLEPGPLLCAHIDLLFDPAFNLDPLNLFRRAARITKLVVLWPGGFSNGTLSYAVPEHSHYRTWRITDHNISVTCLDD